ncbi:hypothetical protein N7486_011162 [Penicillium sp. IBT 16267x]|nr:hypothetical protein N7486_011162 [Penicillium sp. IBT 16267x]
MSMEEKYSATLTWFLGIRIVRDRQQGALWLCQDSYILTMANKYHLTRERRLEVPPVFIANLKPFTRKATDKQKHEFSSKTLRKRPLISLNSYRILYLNTLMRSIKSSSTFTIPGRERSATEDP